MEPIIGSIYADREWSFLGGGGSGMYTTTEEADSMAQLLENERLDGGLGFDVQSTFWASSGGFNYKLGSYCFSDNNNNNSFDISQGNSSYSSNQLFHHDSSQQESYYFNDSNPTASMDYYGMAMADAAAANHDTPYRIKVDDGTCLNQDISHGNPDDDQSAKRSPESAKNMWQTQMESSEMQIAEPAAIEEKSTSTKRSRSLMSNLQINKRNLRPKKSQKIEKDGINATGYWQSTSICCSEEDDETNGSQQLNNGEESSSLSSKGTSALNLNGKTRASRGAANDPQSCYARMRRERINERLRVLQKLIPNGTKVDISTMLEDAVQYVKFLQLQIKLLSSNDLWMYAPIAYNGMDINGLDLKNLKLTKMNLKDKGREQK